VKPKALVDPHPRSLELLFTPDDLRRLRGLVTMTAWEGSRMPAEMVERHLPDATILIGQPDLPRERLARARKLRAIINVEGNPQPNVDYECCFERGIHVLNVGVAFGEAVAEMALGLALATIRGIPEADRCFRRGQEVYGRFSNQESFLLAGAEVGFIGFGNLGRALLKLLQPFHCRVRVYDPWLPERWLVEAGMEPAHLETVLRTSRVLFVLAGGTTENRAMLGARQLDLMPKGASLILVSRASLVDFEALTRKLARGGIRAAVDVFPEEPFPKSHPIRKLPNVILSAHRAGSLSASYRLMGEMIVDDVRQILGGFPPIRLQRMERETVGRLRSMTVKK
jgi:phosphoglycerate dehydrogenase-like enzyme